MAEELSDLKCQTLKLQLEKLLVGDHECSLRSSKYCSGFCELVEEHTRGWQVPLPKLKALQTALCCFVPAVASFPSDCEHVHYALSSLALSILELLLFFEREEFLDSPLREILDSLQESHSCLVRHKNVHLMVIKQIIKDGGAWENPSLQAILQETVQSHEEVEKYLRAETPAFLEMRVRYLVACERIQEAVVLAKCCIEHLQGGRHLYFHQAYLTCLWKASLFEHLRKEIALLDGRDAVEIVCNTESEEKDGCLLALSKEFLTQQLQNGDMNNIWDLIFIWSKLHFRLNPSKQDFLEECHLLIMSATNIRCIFPFIKVIQDELGKDGLHFCVELCARALQADLHHDAVTTSLIHKTLAYLLPDDLEVCRTCALLVFFQERTVESFKTVYLLYMHPDQEYHVECSLIKNQLRFEILHILKKGLFFDPEFWNLITLRAKCLKLMREDVLEDALVEITEEDKWIPNHLTKEPCTLHFDTFEFKARKILKKPVKEASKPLIKRIVVPPEVVVESHIKRRGRKPGSRVIEVVDDSQFSCSFRNVDQPQGNGKQQHSHRHSVGFTERTHGRRARKTRQSAQDVSQEQDQQGKTILPPIVQNSSQLVVVDTGSLDGVPMEQKSRQTLHIGPVLVQITPAQLSQKEDSLNVPMIQQGDITQSISSILVEVQSGVVKPRVDAPNVQQVPFSSKPPVASTSCTVLEEGLPGTILQSPDPGLNKTQPRSVIQDVSGLSRNCSDSSFKQVGPHTQAPGEPEPSRKSFQLEKGIYEEVVIEVDIVTILELHNYSKSPMEAAGYNIQTWNSAQTGCTPDSVFSESMQVESGEVPTHVVIKQEPAPLTVVATVDQNGSGFEEPLCSPQIFAKDISGPHEGVSSENLCPVFANEKAITNPLFHLNSTNSSGLGSTAHNLPKHQDNLGDNCGESLGVFYEKPKSSKNVAIFEEAHEGHGKPPKVLDKATCIYNESTKLPEMVPNIMDATNVSGEAHNIQVSTESVSAGATKVTNEPSAIPDTGDKSLGKSFEFLEAVPVIATTPTNIDSEADINSDNAAESHGGAHKLVVERHRSHDTTAHFSGKLPVFSENTGDISVRAPQLSLVNSTSVTCNLGHNGPKTENNTDNISGEAQKTQDKEGIEFILPAEASEMPASNTLGEVADVPNEMSYLKYPSNSRNACGGEINLSVVAKIIDSAVKTSAEEFISSAEISKEPVAATMTSGEAPEVANEMSKFTSIARSASCGEMNLPAVVLKQSGEDIELLATVPNVPDDADNISGEGHMILKEVPTFPSNVGNVSGEEFNILDEVSNVADASALVADKMPEFQLVSGESPEAFKEAPQHSNDSDITSIEEQVPANLPAFLSHSTNAHEEVYNVSDNVACTSDEAHKLLSETAIVRGDAVKTSVEVSEILHAPADIANNTSSISDDGSAVICETSEIPDIVTGISDDKDVPQEVLKDFGREHNNPDMILDIPGVAVEAVGETPSDVSKYPDKAPEVNSDSVNISDDVGKENVQTVSFVESIKTVITNDTNDAAAIALESSTVPYKAATGPDKASTMSSALSQEKRTSTILQSDVLPQADSLVLNYRCKVCRKNFKGNNILRHAFAHLQKEKLNCIFCRKKFARQLVAKKHIIEHFEEFKRSPGNSLHIPGDTEKQRKQIPQQTQLRSSTRTRKTVERLDPSRVNSECRKQPVQNGPIINGKDKNESEKRCCPANGCDKMFSNKGFSLLRHALRAHPCDVKIQEYAFQWRNGKCCFCQREFHSFQHFQDHFKRYNRPLKYVCYHLKCEQRFKLNAELQAHMKDHQPLQAKCCFAACGRMFSRICKLHEHEESHYLLPNVKVKSLHLELGADLEQRHHQVGIQCERKSRNESTVTRVCLIDSAEKSDGTVTTRIKSSGEHVVPKVGEQITGPSQIQEPVNQPRQVTSSVEVSNGHSETKRAKVSSHPVGVNLRDLEKVEQEARQGSKPLVYSHCVRLPPSAYLDEKFISMPKRRRVSSPYPTSRKDESCSSGGNQGHRCDKCFLVFSSAGALKGHLATKKCTSLFGFDSDEESVN